MEEILQFMSQWKLASHRHIPAGRGGRHTALDVDTAEGRRRRAGTGSREGGSSATPTGPLYGYPYTASSSMGTSETVDSVRSPAGDCEAEKARGRLEWKQSRLQPERMTAAITDGSHTLPAGLSIPAGT